MTNQWGGHSPAPTHRGMFMKKIINCIAALALTFLCMSTAYAQPQVYSNGYFRYVVENGGATIISYYGTEEEVVVPSTVGAGHPVSGIAQGAFLTATDTKKITLPDTVMTVEEDAFAEHQEVIFPGVTKPEQKPTQPSNSGGTAGSTDSENPEEAEEPAIDPSTHEPFEGALLTDEATIDFDSMDAARRNNDVQITSTNPMAFAFVVLAVLAIGGIVFMLLRRKKQG